MTFFDSRANAHLIDGQLAENEKLQLISSKSRALRVIGGGSIIMSMEILGSIWDLEKTKIITR